MSKDEQLISAYFNTSFIVIHWQMSEIWSLQCLRIKFEKYHLGLLTGFNSHCNSQYCEFLYGRRCQICSLVVCLLLLWISAQRSSKCSFSWFHPSWFIDQWSVTSPSCGFEFGGSTDTLILAAGVGVNLVNRCRCHY